MADKIPVWVSCDEAFPVATIETDKPRQLSYYSEIELTPEELGDLRLSFFTYRAWQKRLLEACGYEAKDE